MTIPITVTFSEDAQPVNPNEPKLLDVMGGEYEIALQLSDLFTAVKEAIEGTVDQESELNIEVTGAVELKANSEAKFLVFNVGGSASKTNTMTVSLQTKIKPFKGKK